MTRNELLAEVGRRLGDTSTDFRTNVLSPALDFVLNDLAQHDCIPSLRQTDTMALVADQRTYDTQMFVTSPDFPLTILAITVYGWGTPWGDVPMLPDDEFRRMRLQDGEDLRGMFKGWRLYPNEQTIEVHPPADADAVTLSGTGAEILYLAPPSILAGGDAIVEVRREDLETLVFGIQARMAGFSEATAGDQGGLWQMYAEGRQRMWGNRYNRGVGVVGLTLF